MVTNKQKYFSDYFKINKSELTKLGVFDPILNFDTKLFVDPLLLKQSSSNIIQDAFNKYNKFFERLIKLLMISTKIGDNAWKEAKRMVKFPEYKSTCIGYGSDSINGSGSGANLHDKIFESARGIVEKAKNDPEIFLLLPLLEDGIGADRISDMTQGIIDNEICKYTIDIMQKLGLNGDMNYTTARNTFIEQPQTYRLLKNPYSDNLAIKLLPFDILASLPLADNFDKWIVDVVDFNQKLRDDVSRHFGFEWFDNTKKYKKETLMERLKTDKEFFLEVLKAIKDASFQHYDIEKDAEGLHRWLSDSEKLIPLGSLDITGVEDNLESILLMAENIITHFKETIDKTEFWRVFWTKNGNNMRHVKEFYSQMLFFAVCETWLVSQSSNLKLTREFNHATKQLDFRFTISNTNNVCVQVKHANSNGLETCYGKQALFYHTAKNTQGFYIVMNFQDVSNVIFFCKSLIILCIF